MLFIIAQKLILFTFWFVVGVTTYLKFFPNSLKFKINQYSFFELTLIIFTSYCCFIFIGSLFFNYLGLPFEEVNYSIFSNMTTHNPEGTTTNTTQPSTSDYSGRATDGAIVSVALAGGFKIAEAMPSLAGKAAALGGAVLLGSGAIIAKNISGNISKDIGKKNFLPDSLYDSLRRYGLFSVTGNNGLDLLNMIQFFNKLQFFFVFLFIYNSLLLYVKEKTLENYLLKFFPASLVSLCIRSIQYGKKAALVVCICSFILLTISNAYSYYYLEFFIANIEKIVAIWPK